MTTSAPSGFGASSGPNFVTQPEAFDFIFIGGMQNPGICKVTHMKKHDWDKKKSKGSTGGTVTFTGNPLVEFSVEYYLWLPEHFDAWPSFATIQRKSLTIPASGTGGPKPSPGQQWIAGPQGGVAASVAAGAQAAAASKAPSGIITPAKTQPVALDVYYPTLAAINVLRCIVEEEGGLVPDGKGAARYTYKYAEYNPPKTAGGTVTASKDAMGGTGGKVGEQPAATAADKMLALVLAKASAL